MRKIVVLTILLLLLLLISPIAGARHEAYSVAPSSDEGIYSFFSDVIRDAGICLDKFVDESPDADTRASRLESVVKLAEEESRFYAVKGFESNVSRVVQPFIAPSGGVKQLTTYQLVFLTNYEILKSESDYSAYVEARTAIVKMRSGADAINSSLDRIELIELRNETSILIFNVSDLSERLIDVYALIDHYERLLEQYEIEAPAFEEDILVVAVSDEHPLLYEEITIHVYAKNISTISLFIDNEAHSLKNLTSDLQKKHRFEKPGEHDIYAEGTTVDGKDIKSNIVKVDVSEIPTFIVLSSQYSALLNESVKISGLIVDYYGKPLHAVNVTVEAGEKETVTSDVRGRFVFYGTRSSEGYLNVSAFYPGNDTYKSSSANISIFFSRFPISLHIAANTTGINVNETVNFRGSVSGISTNYTIPLSIFVNDRGDGTITAENNFEFTLPFSQSGTYEVYTLFHGDSVFKDAKSNEVTITVTEKPFFQKESFIKEIITNNRESNILFYLFLLLLVAIVSFFIGLYAHAIKKKIPLALLFTGIYARTFKRMISALREIRGAKDARHRTRIHAFRDKLIAPLLLILMYFYTLILKLSGHSSKEKEAEQGNESPEKSGIVVANEEVGKGTNDEAPEVKKLEDFDIGEAYRLLSDATIAQYDLGKSLTPRELSEVIDNKNEPFTGAFRDVTAIHERVFYGCMAPVDGEEERYFNEIGDILRYFKG
uniref:DUF4129 domain-containing protein n=1 Tax=Candidatus Methanophaga sp. ANME-1 ERB7 TaxID=2759913 RepID=A0A7G9Z544_9EURY|nr:hypothetical protein BNGNOALE_00004 [Methanosarcinales archaeon ANME-1 ERB7]